MKCLTHNKDSDAQPHRHSPSRVCRTWMWAEDGALELLLWAGVFPCLHSVTWQNLLLAPPSVSHTVKLRVETGAFNPPKHHLWAERRGKVSPDPVERTVNGGPSTSNKEKSPDFLPSVFCPLGLSSAWKHMIFEPGERGEWGGGRRRLFLFSLHGSMQTYLVLTNAGKKFCPLGVWSHFHLSFSELLKVQPRKF